jgi:predicted restriction endonuclease
MIPGEVMSGEPLGVADELVLEEAEERPRTRNQTVARRVARAAYAFQGCVICGLQLPTCIAVAHLDQVAGNNDADNLAFLCHTHHWMFDAGLYPIDAVKLLRAHWMVTKGVASHGARMKDAGMRAAATRRRRASARQAWVTRRAAAQQEST